LTEQPEDREAEAAAAEAGQIGGPAPDTGADPAKRPVEEAGGGEAEGFELAEDALRRQASHEDSGMSPTQDAFTGEVESDRSGAEYGEADEAAPRDEGA
jgi:uncharacterized protein (UPF0548 family)